MPTAEATVPTERASRYLAQLCSHLHHMSDMRHSDHGAGRGDGPARPKPTVEHVDHSDTDGSIRFTTGLCTLHATPDTLVVRVETDDEDTLHQLQTGLAQRLEKIGRRDGLTVTWHQSPTATPAGGNAGPQPTPPPAIGPRRRRGWLGIIGLVAVAALVVVVHAGLLGGILAGGAFEKWGLGAGGVIVALVLVKILIGGAHVLGGGYALRRGKRVLPARWQSGHSPLRHLPQRRRRQPDSSATDQAVVPHHQEHA
jgi:hypothetical protein